MGFGGIFTLGSIAFWLIGAYISAILSMKLFLSPWISMPIAGVFTAIIGLIVGLPCLRIKGVHTSLFTLMVFLCLGPVIIWARPWGTGGTQGLIGIPHLNIGTFKFNIYSYYYFALCLGTFIIFILYKIINSSVGKAIIAVRDAPERAKSLGVNEYKYNLFVFTISSFFLGLAGAFYGHWMGALSTHLLGLSFFLLALLMVEGGGLSKLSGGIVGAFTVIILNELFRPLGSWRLVVFGALILTIIILVPEGLVNVFDMLKHHVVNAIKSNKLKFRKQ
jgi:branched-chain amino acid transport system permease protein